MKEIFLRAPYRQQVEALPSSLDVKWSSRNHIETQIWLKSW